MIYTIGSKKVYLEAIANSPSGNIKKEGKSISKAHPGSYAFQSIEDAQRRIDEEKSCYGYYGDTVFGLKADWETDTEPNEDGIWWHNLLIDAEVVMLGIEHFAQDKIWGLVKEDLKEVKDGIILSWWHEFHDDDHTDRTFMIHYRV